MKNVLVSSFDRAANQFGPIVTNTNVQSAIRSYSAEVNRVDKNNPLHTNSEDFDLYLIGYFDTENGDVTDEGNKVPTRIARAQDLKTETAISKDQAYEDLKKACDALLEMHKETTARTAKIYEENLTAAIKTKANGSWISHLFSRS